jgi:anthranilate synthase component 2
MKVALVDNFDSFVYNLAQLLRERPGTLCDVYRADRIVPDMLADYEKILFSPGPGLPEPGNIMEVLVRHYLGRKPMLGVCLGHQAIASSFGARLIQLETVCHGMIREITPVVADYLFESLASPFKAGLYHSWLVDEQDLPACFAITARAANGTIMALAHREHDIRGVQFHPESIMTPVGRTLLHNWLRH